MTKEVVWMGSSLKDLREFPEGARSEVGYALYLAQNGDRAANAVPLTGFGGASVLELVIPERGDTYRAVYTVKFDMAVYVLHAFQKKSKKAAKTPQHEMRLIRSRLKAAEVLHRKKATGIANGKKHEKGTG
jgi:phage-related protein